jgi:hypothetical protein
MRQNALFGALYALGGGLPLQSIKAQVRPVTQCGMQIAVTQHPWDKTSVEPNPAHDHKTATPFFSTVDH